MTIDTSNWDRTFAEYRQFHRKSVAEIINKKLFWISLWALQLTKKADRQEIQTKLVAPAQKYPDAPLVGILVQMEQKRKYGKGITGAALSKEITKKMKQSVRGVNFLRSGWIPAKKEFERYIKSKGDILSARRYAPKDVERVQGVKSYGRDKGKGVPAIINRERAFGLIENAIFGGAKPSDKVTTIISKGLEAGINKEIAKMKQDIERHYNPATDKLNK